MLYRRVFVAEARSIRNRILDASTNINTNAQHIRQCVCACDVTRTRGKRAWASATRGVSIVAGPLVFKSVAFMWGRSGSSIAKELRWFTHLRNLAAGICFSQTRHSAKNDAALHLNINYVAPCKRICGAFLRGERPRNNRLVDLQVVGMFPLTRAKRRHFGLT